MPYDNVAHGFFRVEVLQPDGWHLVWSCSAESGADDLRDEIAANTGKSARVVPIPEKGEACTSRK